LASRPRTAAFRLFKALREETKSLGIGEAQKPSRNTEGDEAMPLINVKLIEGVFNETQKRKMVTDLTDAMVAIEGENMRQVTWVVIEEVKSGNWALGGKPLTTADVQMLQEKRSAA
jgi:4-oxalocrotonate tautomerase